MTGIDALILVLLAVSAGLGAARGWRRGLVDLASLVGGLLLALVGWPAGHWLLRHVIGLPDLLSGPLGVGLVAAAGVALISLLGTRWVLREQELTRPSRVAGGGIGALLGAIGVGPMLLLAATVFGAADQLQQSALARPFLAALPGTYNAAELLGVRVPKVVMVPVSFATESDGTAPRFPTFRPINFRRLEGSTCLKCRERMKFLGYKTKDRLIPVPKFQCGSCGRTSDGCQGFESFHAMYHGCPVSVADKGYQLDCGIWTNGEMVWPKGPCPVCGKEYHEKENDE
jgi:hypothetical protein